jgi:hypothetical protein
MVHRKYNLNYGSTLYPPILYKLLVNARESVQKLTTIRFRKFDLDSNTCFP